MCAYATITDGNSIRRIRCAVVILLAVSVFTLGLRTKLALYRSIPPSMRVTLTKLALDERTEVAASLPASEASPDIAVITFRPAQLVCFSPSLAAQTQRESEEEDGLCTARHHLVPLLYHKPPPTPSTLQMPS